VGTPDLKLGRIVRVRVPDSHGAGDYKKRPVVVLRAPTLADQTFDWIGVSTQPPSKLESPFTIALDYADSPTGHRYTKLQEPSFLYCRWVGIMAVIDIEDAERDVRGTLHPVQIEVMLTILASIKPTC